MFEYVTMERLHMINIMTTMEKFSEYPHSHRQSNGWKQFCIVVFFFLLSCLPFVSFLLLYVVYRSDIKYIFIRTH